MSFIMSPGHAITMGGLRLMQAGRPAIQPGFTLDVSRDGSTWGNPSVVVSSLISELSDGDIVAQEHTGNREPVLYVRIEADTHAGLVAGDTALSAVVGGACSLTWQPPDPLAPPTVIDVVHSRMDHQWDDWDALNRRRVWMVSMSALPWPRSADLVVTPAVATTTPTVVNAGSATTGWSSVNSTPAVVSGAIVSSYNSAVPTFHPAMGGQFAGTSLSLTATINTLVDKYIAIDWKSSLSATPFMFLSGSGQSTKEARRDSLTAGYVRSWYKVPDSTTSVASFIFYPPPLPGAGPAPLPIDQVQKSATLPSTAVKQQTRTIDPGGNVPAQGTILVQHPTAGLGQTIVFSHPADGGYSPPMRQWRAASGTVIADAGAVSGLQNPLDTVMSFVIPAASVPRGDVHLWARIVRATAGSGTVSGAAYSAAGAGAYVGDSQTFAVQRTFPANVWQVFQLARLTLPTANIGIGGYVQIDVVGAGLIIDDAWLFAMDQGRLTVLDCGTGTPTVGTISNRLRVSAPSLEEPNGSILVGVAADWSNAHTPASSTVQCDQTGHRFDPDGSMIHIVTSGPTTEASASFEHYPRFRAEAG